MSKRLTDTDKFQKEFYRNLPAAYKLFWEYILCDCDCAGIWIVEPDIAQIRIGKDCKIDVDKALQLFNEGQMRAVPICDGKRWFIPDFINFQYGKLSSSSKIYKGILQRLLPYHLEEFLYALEKGLPNPLESLTKGFENPLERVIDIVIDKDKVKDKEIVKETEKENSDETEVTEKMVELFKSVCISLPVPSVTKQRIQCTPVRLKEFEKYAKDNNLQMDGWQIAELILQKTHSSEFLSGRGGSGFRCSYDWIFCCKTNWVKIIEGNYDDVAQSPNRPQNLAPGQVLHTTNGVPNPKLKF